MNDILKEKIRTIDELIKKVENTLNLSLDFDSIGIFQTNIYQNNLSELEKEIAELKKDNFFDDIIKKNVEETNEYYNNLPVIAQKYCLLTIKIPEQIKEEKEAANKFIIDKNKGLKEKEALMNENNIKINDIREKIRAKNKEIHGVELELSKNLSNATLVMELNEKLNNLTNDLTIQQKSLGKLINENKKIEIKKGKSLNGTHTVSAKFKPRSEVKFREAELPKDSELYKIIEESKAKYNEIAKIVNEKIDIDKVGLVGVATYLDNIEKLQKEMGEGFVKNYYNRIAVSKDQLTNEQLANGIYKLSIVNKKINSEGYKKLEEKKNEYKQLYNNGIKEYQSLKDKIENNKKQIENYKKINMDIRSKIANLENNLNNKDEIDKLNDTISKNNSLIDELLKENESLAREIQQLLNGGRTRNKLESNEGKKIEPEKTTDIVPPENTNKPEQIKIKKNNPKLSWKTAISVAIGVGVGTAVFFAAGPLGVGIMNAAGAFGKSAIKSKQKNLLNMSETEKLKIISVKPPKNGFEKAINNFKKYLNSEEGLRDMQWLISSAIITGTVLSIGSTIQNNIASKMPSSPSEGGIVDTPTQSVKSVQPTAKPTVQSTVKPTVKPTNIVSTQPAAPAPSPYDNIVLGNNVGGYNVSVGHTNAANAVNGFQSKTLISKYVNSDSIFNRFAVINNDGSLGQIINTNGLSLTDFCAKNGIDISQIAVDVARKDGASQAWISISELTKDIGGMSL